MATTSALAAEFARIRSMSDADLAAYLAAQATPARKMSIKVSEKGAISVYGFGRFPFTFYKSQFDALFTDDNIAALRAFRTANDLLLATKD